MADPAHTLTETVTLSEAKSLITAMAHAQSILLLSAPGLGKSHIVQQAAAAAGLPPLAARHADCAGRCERRAPHCRRALGVLPAADSLAGKAGALLSLSR